MPINKTLRLCQEGASESFRFLIEKERMWLGRPTLRAKISMPSAGISKTSCARVPTQFDSLRTVSFNMTAAMPVLAQAWDAGSELH